MDKDSIIKKLFSKKGKDYTYTIAFFLIFSFFLFFVIRPNILAVFQANLRIESLKKTNAFYERQIQNVINSQAVLVESRDDLQLLDEALTKKPQVNRLIADITNTVIKNNLAISSLNLIDVNLKDVSRSDQLKTLDFNIGLIGNFDDYFNLMKDFYDQRRLKLLNEIIISRQLSEGSASGSLKINLQLKGYYL